MIAALLLLASALSDPTPAQPERDASLETGIATGVATGLCYAAGPVSYQVLFGEAVIEPGGLHPLMLWTFGTPTLAVLCGSVTTLVTPMVLGEAPRAWGLAGSVGGGMLGALVLGGPGAVWLLSSSASERRTVQGWVFVVGAGLGFAVGSGMGAGFGQGVDE